jgi:hypothetical protein
LLGLCGPSRACTNSFLAAAPFFRAPPAPFALLLEPGFVVPAVGGKCCPAPAGVLAFAPTVDLGAAC